MYDNSQMSSTSRPPLAKKSSLTMLLAAVNSAGKRIRRTAVNSPQASHAAKAKPAHLGLSAPALTAFLNEKKKRKADAPARTKY